MADDSQKDQVLTFESEEARDAAMDALSGRRAGPAAAVMTAGLDVGKIVGPLIGGFVASLLGLEAMFVIVPLAFLLVAYAGALAGRRRRGGDPAAPAA